MLRDNLHLMSREGGDADTWSQALIWIQLWALILWQKYWQRMILSKNPTPPRQNPWNSIIVVTALLLFNTFRSHTVDDLVDVLESFASKCTPVCWLLCFSLTLYPSEVKCDASYLPNCCARAPHLQHDCLDEYSSLWRMLWHKVNLWARQKL